MVSVRSHFFFEESDLFHEIRILRSELLHVSLQLRLILFGFVFYGSNFELNLALALSVLAVTFLGVFFEILHLLFHKFNFLMEKRFFLFKFAFLHRAGTIVILQTGFHGQKLLFQLGNFFLFQF